MAGKTVYRKKRLRNGTFLIQERALHIFWCDYLEGAEPGTPDWYRLKPIHLTEAEADAKLDDLNSKA